MNEFDIPQQHKDVDMHLILPQIEIEENTPQPFTPSSDAITMPLEGFLEAPRLSCHSRTHSDLSQPKYVRQYSDDGSSDVFTTTVTFSLVYKRRKLS
ncbi:uncharacterized protein LOC131996445 [Stomoxys calcitrans]|uniref:uncharacterized protein LOC131996445 n=1 Tax=Stomoxys calcitrans TaxID=35570 RepID=UPI0027E24164|nr:uncharacterized protein LOC131996445 [Stomoxys calcitrans]